MHQMVSGHVWMLYALTIGLVLAFCLAGLYALSATGDIRRLPLTRAAVITIVVLYSLRALAGGISCINDFTWLQCISSLILRTKVSGLSSDLSRTSGSEKVLGYN